MNPAEERFHNGDTEPEGIPVIRDDSPPPPPGGILRPITVPVPVSDNRPSNRAPDWFGVATFGVAVFAVVFVVLLVNAQGGGTKSPAAQQAPTPAPSTSSPAATVPEEKPETQEPETEPATQPVPRTEEVTCTAEELPVSYHGTITCATEAETCALGSSFVPLTSNCGQPVPGSLISAGTYDEFSPGDCLELRSGSFEAGTVAEVSCTPMAGVSAIVNNVFFGYLTDAECFSDDGSRQVFLAHHYSDSTDVQTLCLTANNGA